MERLSIELNWEVGRYAPRLVVLSRKDMRPVATNMLAYHNSATLLRLNVLSMPSCHELQSKLLREQLAGIVYKWPGEHASGMANAEALASF